MKKPVIEIIIEALGWIFGVYALINVWSPQGDFREALWSSLAFLAFIYINHLHTENRRDEQEENGKANR